MEQVEVEIIGMVITQRYGTLNTGDILRTDAAFAKHLVEDAQGARYTTPKAPPTLPAAAPAKEKTTKASKPEAQKDTSAAPAPDAPSAAEAPAAGPQATPAA